MGNPVAAIQDRCVLKPIFVLMLADDLPADYKAATINTYIATANRVEVLSGTDGVSPSPVTSELTTEGKSVTQALDLSGTPIILAQDPVSYKALRALYHQKDVRIVELYVASVDNAIDGTTGAITVLADDVVEISHKLKFAFYLNNVSGQEMQATSNYAQQVDADDDSVAAYEVVLADA